MTFISALRGVWSRVALAAAMLLAGLALPALAQEAGDPNFIPASQDPARTPNGLGQLPPMGWNSYNKYECKVTEADIRANADAIATNGMRELGYRYVIIDDCWEGARDKDGNLTAEPTRFPSGIKALADYVHARGLLFGIYSDGGIKTCAGFPGSQGHEFQDAATFARWGVDYLKYDWCEARTRNSEEAYSLMADALRATGRPILFSMCEWGLTKPWLWSEKIGNIRRTTGDLADAWSGVFLHQRGVMQIVALNEPLWSYAGPGHYNDPDMLQVGNGGMTDAEYRSHFSLWAMMAAPLIAGNDTGHMTPATKAILLNAEVIAVDQDPMGKQGRRLAESGGAEVWQRDLAGGAKAYLLFNASDKPTPIGVDTADMGFVDGKGPRVRDLWAHRDVTVSGKRYIRTVPPHDVVMIRVG
ncbi:MAG: glycoside hydrolase family 27 protein [Sphingomonadaceae bacterium]|nr:glycoside hydrolase family 27 protein [Sphingomonadaceae bacterium]